MTDVVEEGMRAVLGGRPRQAGGNGRRVRLPLVPARPDGGVLFGGMTADEIHERLDALQLEADQERGGPSA